MTANGLIIALLGATCVFLFAISLIPAKSPLTQTLDALQSHDASKNTGDLGLERMLEEILPKQRVGTIVRKLLQAGWYDVSPSQIILRVLAAATAALAASLLITPMLGLSGPLQLFAALMVVAIGAYAPYALLDRAIDRRKAEVQRTLPDFLDMMASTVQAGLAVNAALAYAVDAAPGALGDEIKEALAEIRLGRAKADALKAAAYRLNQAHFTTTVTALTQAERLGSNVADVLSELAEDTRNARLMLIEERAAKLPVTMVLPMAFFLLPALFIMIFGAVAANFVASQT